MKKYFKYLLIVSVIITLSFLVYMIFSNKHKDKYTSLKKTVSNTFFFLYNDKYDDMNDISDNCKMSLLFDYNGFKSDKVIINEGGKKIHGYSKNNIATSLKKILGKDSSINFSLNNENLYNFMSDTECIYNSKVSDLSYDSTKQILYSDGKEHHNDQQQQAYFSHGLTSVSCFHCTAAKGKNQFAAMVFTKSVRLCVK